jgi:hypothetical protein
VQAPNPRHPVFELELQTPQDVASVLDRRLEVDQLDEVPQLLEQFPHPYHLRVEGESAHVEALELGQLAFFDYQRMAKGYVQLSQ